MIKARLGDHQYKMKEVRNGCSSKSKPISEVIRAFLPHLPVRTRRRIQLHYCKAGQAQRPAQFSPPGPKRNQGSTDVPPESPGLHSRFADRSRIPSEQPKARGAFHSFARIRRNQQCHRRTCCHCNSFLSLSTRMAAHAFRQAGGSPRPSLQPAEMPLLPELPRPSRCATGTVGRQEECALHMRAGAALHFLTGASK